MRQRTAPVALKRFLSKTLSDDDRLPERWPLSRGRGLSPEAEVRARLADEKGTIFREGGEAVALLYPSPYNTGMSSLGFQTIYRLLHERPGRVAHRAFLPDDVAAFS